ncbi:uncharacterized protein [Porites lutea]|uniref:uncharacterized protein n=1 Tax=Porites lutea TaxID=51062 RepID=UPI003CC531FF
MAETVKRKSRKSSSASSTDDNLSQDGKKLRHDASLSDSELCESDEVLSILNMAGEVIPKLEQVLEKLENLERYVKAVDEKVSSLQAKVDCFEAFKNKTEKKIKELEDGLDFANTERESFKEKFDKLKCEINQLRDEKLYMEVYQRRENLRFFGIKEEADMEEDAREVLVGFLKTELGMKNADQIEFQRVHRVGKRVSSSGKPRQIIARFLKYPQREEVMSNARKLKGKNFGISPDLPSEILERRKKKMKQFKQAKKDGKTTFFSRAEPDKLFIDGVEM